MATFLTVDKARDNEAMIRRLTRDPDEAPTVVDGIRWWAVGQNASHTFYLGLDTQGQLWRTAFGDGDEMLCDCPWNVWCKCPRASCDDVLNRHRRPVKDGDQLYLGR